MEISYLGSLHYECSHLDIPETGYSKNYIFDYLFDLFLGIGTGVFDDHCHNLYESDFRCLGWEILQCEFG